MDERLEQLRPTLEALPEDVRTRVLDDAERSARREAPERLRELWREQDAKRDEERRTAQARLHELSMGADPRSSAPVLRGSAKYEAGRARGRRHREAREAAQRDPFAGFRVVGR